MTTLAEKLVERYLEKSKELARVGFERQVILFRAEGVRATVLGSALFTGVISGKNEMERKIESDNVLALNVEYANMQAQAIDVERQYYEALAEVRAAEALIELQSTPSAQMEA